jgi:hypothetical protein
MTSIHEDAVLREQLDQLIHARTDSRDSKEERNRLDRVANILLEPFGEPTTVWPWKAARRAIPRKRAA